MSNCIITTAGRALIAACQANRQALAIDKMLFGYRDGLDVSAAPPADFTLTAAETRHTATALTSGLLAADCAVWSAVLDAAVGDFSFNIVGLASGSTLVAVAVQPAQHKVKTSGFSTGNVIIKNFGLQIVNVADLTGITVNAETWQQDLSGLYAPLNHNHDDRYSPIGHGHDSRYSPIGHTHGDLYAPLSAMPPGAIMPYAGNVIPAGFLECAGAAVSRTLYAALFTAIGTAWGAGDGATTFNLPNLRTRFLRGGAASGETGGGQSPRAGLDLTFRELDAEYGYSPGRVVTVPSGGGRSAHIPTGREGNAYAFDVALQENSAEVLPPYAAVKFIIRY
ncbi:tail fiber protein [Victivallis sp. Marseille-Q1083]|uniref:tail fiber protein n=1 Tax=Victivallis sp. Marseille-Q1083 TaxID=2717288 RepID=UPI00158DE5E6|nr:tail fiber protein [Victivallis sp. Marseille-Q1083]